MRKIKIIAATNATNEYLDWRKMDFPIFAKLLKDLKDNVAVQGKGTFERHGSIEGAINVLLAKEKPSDLKGIDLVTNTPENIPELLQVFPDKYIYILGGAKVIRELWDKADLIQLVRIHTEMDGTMVMPPMEGFTLSFEEEGRGYKYEIWRKKKDNGLLPKYLRKR